jgi:hypothetical protein
MLLGGGGNGVPLMELFLQVLLAGLVAVWAWVIPSGRLSALPRTVWLLAALIVALPALQLIPLPPALWHALPGRELEIAALGLIGQQDSWQPISLAPPRTLASLLCMIAAAATLVMTASLTRQGRTLLLAAIVAIALLSLLVGAGQTTGDHAAPLRLYVANSNYFFGFQSYRNSEAEVLLVAITATAAVARDLAATPHWQGRKRRLIGLALVITVVLTLGVFHTASRSGIALLAIALPTQLVILRPSIRLSWRQTLIGAVLCAAVMILCAVVLWDNPLIFPPLAPFHEVKEARPEIWKDSLYAARSYLPWGAGMGSFVPVYAAVERLSLVDMFSTNRAHSDYLELYIEGGLLAVAWVTASAHRPSWTAFANVGLLGQAPLRRRRL